MPSSHCTILERFFTRRQVLINRRQMPEIGGKSVFVHASDNQAVWIIKDAIWGNRRCVADAREIFELSAIQNPAVWMSSDWKIHRWWPTANERARYRAAGSSGRSFFFFYKAINVSHLQTACLHFCIRIYRTGRLHEDEEGARVFPINNILL